MSRVRPSLILDLDGTLVDSLPGIATTLNRSLEAHQLPTHPNAAVRSFIGDGIHMLVKRGAPKGTPQQELDAIVAKFKEDYQASWLDGTKPYPAIPLLLKDLQKGGYQLSVLSNKVHHFTQTIVRELFPLIHFTSVIGQQDGMPHKPHPAGAFKIASAMGSSPEQCVVVGDSTTDLETSANAEMHSVAVTWGYHDRDRLQAASPSHLIDNPADLPALLDDFENWTAQ